MRTVIALLVESLLLLYMAFTVITARENMRVEKELSFYFLGTYLLQVSMNLFVRLCLLGCLLYPLTKGDSIVNKTF